MTRLRPDAGTMNPATVAPRHAQGGAELFLGRSQVVHDDPRVEQIGVVHDTSVGSVHRLIRSFASAISASSLTLVPLPFSGISSGSKKSTWRGTL